MEQSVFLTDPSKIAGPATFPNDLEKEFCNEYGAIRRCYVHEHYSCRLINENKVVDLYREWRDDPEYFILRGWTKEKTMQSRVAPVDSNYADGCGVDAWYLDPELYLLYKFIKASKRGNDVYKHLVTKKLKPLRELNNIIFFNSDTVDKRTSLLFVTLTYDNKRCTHNEAWYKIGKEFHLFINNLRKQYGELYFFRTWESTNHYYPHVHFVILFWEKDFVVIEHKDKDGRISYRIPYKEKQKIAKHWHSNIDIQAVEDTDSATKELTKYITKDLCSNKGDKTNAMIWLHGKQSYSVSKGFAEAIGAWNVDFNEPTNRDLINDMCNCNSDVTKWEFVGILRGKHLGFCPDLWCVDIKKPPPRIVDLLIREHKRWLLLHGGRSF